MADPAHRSTLGIAVGAAAVAFAAFASGVLVSGTAQWASMTVAAVFGAAFVVGLMTASYQHRRYRKALEVEKWDPVRAVVREAAEMSDYLSVQSDHLDLGHNRGLVVAWVGRVKATLNRIDSELWSQFDSNAGSMNDLPTTSSTLGRYLRHRRRDLEAMLPEDK